MYRSFTLTCIHINLYSVTYCNTKHWKKIFEFAFKYKLQWLLKVNPDLSGKKYNKKNHSCQSNGIPKLIWLESLWEVKKKVLLLIISDIQHKNLFRALMFLIKTYLIRKTCSMEAILIWTEFTNSANFYRHQLESVTKTSNISICGVFFPLGTVC